VSAAPNWLALCDALRKDVLMALASHSSRAEREQVVGAGAGGDDTTAIDAAAEEAVVTRLESLAAGGHSFVLVSEELGERRYGTGDPRWWIVVDPVDGSSNAKRGVGFYCLSIAIAVGPTLADVAFGYVTDLVSGETFVGARGQGATLDGEQLGDELPKHELELVGLEATSPALLASACAALPPDVGRVRVLGSLALSICQVAAGRLDAVLTLKGSRSVDHAAAQLIAREAGCHVEILGGAGEGLATPLDVERRGRVVVARDAATCQRLASMPA
jgi:myo-inositol-1(or 4)-monophosphatase